MKRIGTAIITGLFLALVIFTLWLSGGNNVSADSEWDNSSLSFESGCSSQCGSVSASVCNGSGSEPMAGSSTYEVWHVLTGNPKDGSSVGGGTIPALGSGDCTTLNYDTGTTLGNFKFRAFQRIGHPGEGELWSDTCTISSCVTSSPTPLPSFSPTPLPSHCSTPTPKPSSSPSPSPSISPSPSPSISPSPSPSISPSPSPSISPSPSPTSTPGGSVGGTSDSGPSECTDAVPDTPYLESVESLSSSVMVKWQKVLSDATHYSIEYGSSSGNYEHSVLNTGNVDTYEVGGLTSGCFAVRTWNGCAASPLSNEVCTGQVAASSSQVLGASTLGETGNNKGIFEAMILFMGVLSTGIGMRKFSSNKVK